MQKDDKKIKIKLTEQFEQSALVGGTLWSIGFLSRRIISQQKYRQLRVNDIFTVGKDIKISADRVLMSRVNYLVCDADRTTVTLMKLDHADYQRFVVTKKSIKRTLIRKDW
ncbi:MULTISPECIES: hypothetical protein [Weissella]|uniref:Uncharacterized protein n=2 Tax=Weissella TaxID=46255 RepID=A0A1L6RAL7_9LACO|nr:MULTISPECIES: hypothetical protein [Weissella]APS41599.1 hypothetical protein FOL01_0740 [Weissella jogaejeotgali]NKY91244.1 hypothetical protein [Weissella thailandensis]RDS59254.1 hypothetical protein DWV05_06825 [Weissella thailandensis]GEP74738.1 hypothetical protein WTH01_09850 [Weissella thailandensis]